jgi:hypothetical protein
MAIPSLDFLNVVRMVDLWLRISVGGKAEGVVAPEE